MSYEAKGKDRGKDKDKDIELIEDYLGQYTRAKKREKRLEQRLKKIKNDMRQPIGGVGYKPINKPQNAIGSGAAGFTFRLSDCELRIYDQKKQVEKNLLNIMDILDYLDQNSDERNVLEMYYIDGLTWEQAAEELPCSRSQVFNLKDKGLNKLLAYSRVRQILRRYEKSRDNGDDSP